LKDAPLEVVFDDADAEVLNSGNFRWVDVIFVYLLFFSIDVCIVYYYCIVLTSWWEELIM
jgi:hypothetical protein